MVRLACQIAASLCAGLLVAGSAHAQCASDDECPTGERCDFGDGDNAVSQEACAPNTDCDAIARPAPQPVGQCTALALGECESDTDCADGLTCQKPSSILPCPATPIDDGSGVSAPEECNSDPVVSRYGYCVMPPAPCAYDGQCLSGLTCVIGDASAPGAGTTSSDSGSTQKFAAKPEGECQYVEKSCETDADCADGYECVTDSHEECASSGGCSSDGDCFTGPAVCETVSESYCFPTLSPCESDDKCADDARCVEFTKEGGALDTPSFWDTPLVSKTCLPEGMALLAQSGSPAGELGSAAEDGLEPPTSPDATADLDEPHEHATDADSEEMDEEDSDSPKSSSKCAVGFAGGNSSALWLLAGLGALLRRRRR